MVFNNQDKCHDYSKGVQYMRLWSIRLRKIVCLKPEYTISISLFTYVHLTLGRVGTSPATPKTVCKQGTFCIAQLVSLNPQLWWVNTLTLQTQLLNRILQIPTTTICACPGRRLVVPTHSISYSWSENLSRPEVIRLEGKVVKTQVNNKRIHWKPSNTSLIIYLLP